MAAECPEQFKGWILKWTNYIKGYQKRWFVLSNGLFSYYRTQEEVAHTCRGTINLASAFIHNIDSTNFMITNGPSQVYHLRALNVMERQKWVTALELAKAKAIKKLDSDVSDGSEDEVKEGGAGGPHESPLAVLQMKLNELTIAYELVVKNSDQIATNRLESGETQVLLKITSSAMVKAAEEFIVQARNTERRWSRALQHEHSLGLELQENLEALANQMHGLEHAARNTAPSSSFQASVSTAQAQAQASTLSSERTTPSRVSNRDATPTEKRAVFNLEPSDDHDGGGDISSVDSDDDDDKFFDASEVYAGDLGDQNLPPGDQPSESFAADHRQNSMNDVTSVASSSASDAEVKEKPPQISLDRRMLVPAGPSASFSRDIPPIIQRRTSIPPKPNHHLNLWSIMKNCIGKDLSKIPMPVNFSEPLSLLQRMSEDLAHSGLLTKAALSPNTMEEAAFVAAYINSAYGRTNSRVAKPFNPMLYETYECDRRAEPEYGWRLVTEQVSHHPPMFAMHVEHADWTFWQEYTVASKFRGQYLVVYPLGSCHLVMHKSKSYYTWTKVTTTIHSIIVGNMWIDQSGDLIITNHTNGEKCHVKYHPYSYFSREQQRKINGRVEDSNGTTRYIIKGHWDDEFTLAKVISGEGKHTVTTTPEVLWQVDPIEPGSGPMYGFPKFVCSLNEPEEGVAPTDARCRPDLRLMEQQDFDGANSEKVKLEEKQRARRRKREANAERAAEAAAAGNMEEAERLEKASTVCPVWFSKEYNHHINSMVHVYQGGYWEAKAEQSWDRLNLPDIF